jgi:hypothetical protein
MQSYRKLAFGDDLDNRCADLSTGREKEEFAVYTLLSGRACSEAKFVRLGVSFSAPTFAGRFAFSGIEFSA